jgi:hypothetical protein
VVESNRWLIPKELSNRTNETPKMWLKDKLQAYEARDPEKIKLFSKGKGQPSTGFAVARLSSSLRQRGEEAQKLEIAEQAEPRTGEELWDLARLFLPILKEERM